MDRRVFERVYKNSYSSSEYSISASHDGYRFLVGKPVHKRKWVISDHSLTIYDTISGKNIHKIKCIYPIHPKVRIGKPKANIVKFNIQSNTVRFQVEGEGNLKRQSSFYNPEFGLSQNNFHLVYELEGMLPLKIVTKISWD